MYLSKRGNRNNTIFAPYFLDLISREKSRNL